MPHNTTKALLRSPELILLPALANTLIQTSCSRDAVAIALHPARWMRRHTSKETRDGARMILRDTPLLQDIAKHLVCVARRFLAGIPQQLPWPHKKKARGKVQFGNIYRGIARDARQYLAERMRQGAEDNRLLADQGIH